MHAVVKIAGRVGRHCRPCDRAIGGHESCEEVAVREAVDALELLDGALRSPGRAA